MDSNQVELEVYKKRYDNLSELRYHLTGTIIEDLKNQQEITVNRINYYNELTQECKMLDSTIKNLETLIHQEDDFDEFYL